MSFNVSNTDYTLEVEGNDPAIKLLAPGVNSTTHVVTLKVGAGVPGDAVENSACTKLTNKTNGVMTYNCAMAVPSMQEVTFNAAQQGAHSRPRVRAPAAVVGAHGLARPLNAPRVPTSALLAAHAPPPPRPTSISTPQRASAPPATP